MNNDKKTIVLYTDYLEQLEQLSREQCGDLLIAILRRQAGLEDIALDQATGIALSFIWAQARRDYEKYEKVSRARSEARIKDTTKDNKVKQALTKDNKAKQSTTKQNKTEHNDNEDEDDNEDDNDIIISSSAASAASISEKLVRQQQGKIVNSFVLRDGSMFDVSEEMAKEFQDSYPDVDVEQELRAVKSWCINNRDKRKTRKGARRFLNGWLCSAQTAAKSKQTKAPVPVNAFHNFDEREYDFDALEAALMNQRQVK